jgi:VWFA-related protein
VALVCTRRPGDTLSGVPASILLLVLLALLGSPLAAQEARLIVTVADQFGFPVKDLTAADFAVTVDKAARAVQSASYVPDSLVDTVLLLDTSQVGAQMRGDIEQVALLFIDRLREKEQMAIIGYATSADMVQDFTSSKSLLRRAVGGLKYGNNPALLDSIYAALDGAFEQSPGRRVLVLVGSGEDARHRVNVKEVLELAQRKAVSVSAISLVSDSDVQKISEQTAGLYYRGRQLKQIQQVVENMTQAFRGHYEVVLSGAPLEAGKLKVEVRRAEKPRVSYRIAR